MRWFRSHIGMGSRLALAAMAVQLVLTFGHVHVDGLAEAAAGTASSVSAGQYNPTSPNAPEPSHKGSGSADIDCPICALIQLASTAAPSVAPTLPVPTSFIVTRPETPAALQRVALPYISFQARGPPSI
jgi:hypothetical protein